MEACRPVHVRTGARRHQIGAAGAVRERRAERCRPKATVGPSPGMAAGLGPERSRGCRRPVDAEPAGRPPSRPPGVGPAAMSAKVASIPSAALGSRVARRVTRESRRRPGLLIFRASIPSAASTPSARKPATMPASADRSSGATSSPRSVIRPDSSRRRSRRRRRGSTGGGFARNRVKKSGRSPRAIFTASRNPSVMISPTFTLHALALGQRVGRHRGAAGAEVHGGGLDPGRVEQRPHALLLEIGRSRVGPGGAERRAPVGKGRAGDRPGEGAADVGGHAQGHVRAPGGIVRNSRRSARRAARAAPCRPGRGRSPPAGAARPKRPPGRKRRARGRNPNRPRAPRRARRVRTAARCGGRRAPAAARRRPTRADRAPESGSAARAGSPGGGRVALRCSSRRPAGSGRPPNRTAPASGG